MAIAIRNPNPALEHVVDLDVVTQDERREAFDRQAFALEALDLLRPKLTTVAVFEGRRLHVDAGRAWGRGPGARWAIVAVPPTASKRAITEAVAVLARGPRPYALAVLAAKAERAPEEPRG